MFCGFGAVVLLVLVMNSNRVAIRQEPVADLHSKLRQQETTNRLVRVHREELQQQYDIVNAGNERLQKKQLELMATTGNLRATLAAQATSPVTGEQITRLQAELKTLQEKASRLAEEKALAGAADRQVRPFEGDGHRQYLTGLKLGGKRVLVLVDSSASMLDRSIVDIVRRKVMDDSSRRLAPKWRKAVATVEWIIANLPADSTIQAYHFNESTTSLAADEAASWLGVTDRPRVDALVAHLREVAPLGGTNLEEAFVRARSMTPQPDNIILITDGLPTFRTAGYRARTIDSNGRAKLFQQAIRQLPPRVPVNIILFPIEGDPFAAVNYWKLAIDSGGSFLTPTRDWP